MTHKKRKPTRRRQRATNLMPRTKKGRFRKRR